jgi:cyclopropane-fatty-acyl-phospholipid synthase
MNSRIYRGEVTHSRLTPVRHSFRYPFYFYAFDIDELPELSDRVSLFGHNRIRPVSIHDKDYLSWGPDSIRSKLERILSDAGSEISLGQILMVTSARYFHYVFNPISFFYCFSLDGQLSDIVIQVNNTFGEMHLYPLKMSQSRYENKKNTFTAQKRFHVSPFFDRSGYYEFLLTRPEESIDNVIRYYNAEKLSLVARIQGQSLPLNSPNLIKTIARYPLSAAMTMPRILWQAARLYWQRRLPVFQKPVPDNRMTIRCVPPSVLDRLGMTIIMKFLSRLPEGELIMILPDGQQRCFGQPGSTPQQILEIKEFRFFRRVMLAGDIGFGESYTDWDWTTDDLPGLLTLLASHEEALDDRSIITSIVGRLINYLRHLARLNTLNGSTRNIRDHYDLSNDFFTTFLDPSLTYSCALFHSGKDTLETAQRNKLRTILDKAHINSEDHVLEIGSGWGSFALEAARQTGCRISGITISREQLELSRERALEASLEKQIDFQFCDYRNVQGHYSKVVSIEMLEAVGHSGLKPFFSACDRVLQPGGRAVIQVITISDQKYWSYRYGSDWIRKHIFPGGHLPSIKALKEAISNSSRLEIVSLETFGSHYARTLDQWRQNLLARYDDIHALGFDREVVRKFEYYFAYCQAGFTVELLI